MKWLGAPALTMRHWRLSAVMRMVFVSIIGLSVGISHRLGGRRGICTT